MPSHGRAYTILFAIALGVICSATLKTVDARLRSRIDLNRRLERVRNVLLVLGISVPRGASGEEIERIYRENIEEIKAEDGRTILYYIQEDPKTGKVSGYVFPIEGMGLWDKVRGLMAIETDLETVRGVSFYEQQETPGLGGRISEAEFTSRFRGKKIYDERGEVGLHIVKPGRARGRNELDGITAATLTCQAVDKFMNEGIKKFLRYVKHERGATAR